MKIKFGKYKGKEVEDLLEINPQYLLWADKEVKNFKLPEKVKAQCIAKCRRNEKKKDEELSFTKLIDEALGRLPKNLPPIPPPITSPQWIRVDDKDRPLAVGVEVLAYNPAWVKYMNISGIRIGFLNQNGYFTSASWNESLGYYETCSSPGDDWDAVEKGTDGTKKTYYFKNGLVHEGFLPNMPTHYLYLPHPPYQGNGLNLGKVNVSL